jgi:hypothetical protein
MVVGCQPHAPAAFTPRGHPWFSFSREAELTPGPWFSRKEMSLKNPVTRPGIDPGTVRLVAQRLNHYATPGPFDISVFFKNLSRKFKYHWNMTRATGSLLYVNTKLHFLYLAHYFLDIKNVSDRSCRENPNTHFLFSNYFLTIEPFVRCKTL